jgi:hypothetical protein
LTVSVTWPAARAGYLTARPADSVTKPERHRQGINHPFA